MKRFPTAMLARWMAPVLVLWCCIPSSASRAVTKLEPISAGVMLPVSLEQRLDAGHVRAGQRITARLMQRIPLADGSFLPTGVKVTGTVAKYDGSALALRFDQLQLKHDRVPVHVMLLAAADWLDVEKAQEPLGAPDRTLANPMNWTTKQIGGDEVYRSGGSGAVYNQYSERVGHADAYGVYAPARTPGAAELAMGLFSTTARGLYDLPGMEIASPGGPESPIVLRLTSPKWQLHGQTALLLQTIAS